jgi:bifunctional non-homologous end joining protein LigD
VSRPTSLPARLRPVLATLVPEAPAGDGWVHEIKFDGYRLICVAERKRVRLYTRTGQDWTERFPTVARAVADLGTAAVLDGEVVVLRPDGRTDFQDLQNALQGSSGGALCYFAFDLLEVEGEDLRARPLLERKFRLAALMGEAPSEGALRYGDHVVGDGPAFHAQACAHGLEGIISKRADAPYRGGRGKDWLKVKCLRDQEFVIGGFTEPSGARSGLGALLVGAYADEGLRFAGRVGTGFTERDLLDLRRKLGVLEQVSPPFVNPPTGAAARGVHWVEPRLVAAVHFTEWTGDGVLRHPSFKGLREDKDARDVGFDRAEAGSRREPAAPAPAGGATVPRRRTRAGRTGGDRVEVEGVALTNPDRVLYAESGYTKLDLAEHYVAVAERMLPLLEGRPLTVVRCPSGHGKCFYQKHFDDAVPKGIARVEIEEQDGAATYGEVRSLAGVIGLVQLGVLEIHTWGAHADRVERPDRMTIDLDPDPSVGWERVVEAALAIRLVLDELGLRCFVKTTGGKGLHVVAPLERRSGWDDVKAFAEGVCALVADTAPDAYTLQVSKAKRRGKILLDYLRNARGATAVEAYSTRARAGAPVALPVEWDELADIRSDTFRLGGLAGRLSAPDPWADYPAVRQAINARAKRRLGLR